MKEGERIYQMIIAKNEKAEWLRVEALLDSERRADGFRQTGKI